MTRIFTTDFIFNQQPYHAIVSMTVKEKVSFTVKVLDIDLHDLLPEGMVKYEGMDGFKNITYLDNATAQSLMQSIAAAIEEHLSAMA